MSPRRVGSRDRTRLYVNEQIIPPITLNSFTVKITVALSSGVNSSKVSVRKGQGMNERYLYQYDLPELLVFWTQRDHPHSSDS